MCLTKISIHTTGFKRVWRLNLVTFRDISSADAGSVKGAFLKWKFAFQDIDKIDNNIIIIGNSYIISNTLGLDLITYFLR